MMIGMIMFERPKFSNNTALFSDYHNSIEEKYVIKVFLITFIIIIAVGVYVIVRHIFDFRRNQAVIKQAFVRRGSDLVIDVNRKLEQRREGIFLPFDNDSMKAGRLLLGKN